MWSGVHKLLAITVVLKFQFGTGAIIYLFVFCRSLVLQGGQRVPINYSSQIAKVS